MNVSLSITERLSILPPKVGKKLSGLLALGHVDSPTLETVLDAVELSGHPEKALWFTSSYLFLRSKGVPVGDVIAMAKQHQRRLLLEWSENRWRSEHESLSRLETLKRLSAVNEHYDLSLFQQLLPERFSGYLVKSSRRLGMEGLRQRHCVASYHDRIRSGVVAIASVFVSKVRWTVELIVIRYPELLLRIGQIKSRYNEVATEAVRREVCQQLGIDFRQQSDLSGVGGRNTVHEQQLRLILPILKHYGIQLLRVEFSGYNDSGQIDSVLFTPSLTEMPDVILPVLTSEHQNGQWFDRIHNRTMLLDQAMIDIVYGYLEMTGVDWYNNAGGQGYFSINFEEEIIEFNVDENYTETVTGYSNEWALDEFYQDENDPTECQDAIAELVPELKRLDDSGIIQ